MDTDDVSTDISHATLSSRSADEVMNVRLQEHSSKSLVCHISGKAKQAAELVKVQSVLLEESNRGFKISVTKICRTIV